jgi:hypothetical protein
MCLGRPHCRLRFLDERVVQEHKSAFRSENAFVHVRTEAGSVRVVALKNSLITEVGMHVEDHGLVDSIVGSTSTILRRRMTFLCPGSELFDP